MRVRRNSTETQQ